MRGYPQFSFWNPIALAKICFNRMVINHTKILRYYEVYYMCSALVPIKVSTTGGPSVLQSRSQDWSTGEAVRLNLSILQSSQDMCLLHR